MSRNLARLTNEAIAIVRYQGRFRSTSPWPTNTMSPGPGAPSTPSSIRPMPGPEITPATARTTGQLRSPSKHVLPGGSDPPSIPLNRNRSNLQPFPFSLLHPEPATHSKQEMFLQLRGSGLTRNPAAPSIRLQRVLIPETDCAPCRGSTRAFPVV